MILCCGEALIDMIPIDGGPGFVPHPGGAVFNTAIALGRLGAPVGLLTGLSRDVFGDQLRAALRASHVDTALAVTSDRPSTLAFVHLTDGAARYSFYDENSAGRMVTPTDMPALPARVTALFFGGISLACTPSAEAYAHVLRAQGAGRAVMIDPNIRPGFISDEAGYRARLGAMLAAADIVKVSDEDLGWLLPGPAPLAEKAAALRAEGPGLVIVTEGARGAAAFGAGHAPVRVEAAAARVVDTVGAGDTFNAGLLADLEANGLLTKAGLAALKPAALERAMRFAARAAAFTVSRPGAAAPFAAELG